jgi:SAM-dependent methyltransferase
MNIKDVKGLKYPDEYIIKFFFKESLFLKKGSVLEFGSGNGNNLSLFYSYNYNVTGLDFDSELISYANGNFSNFKKSENIQAEFEFIHNDLRDSLDNFSSKFDIVLFPNILYYLTYKDILIFLKKFSQKKIIKDNGYLFFRMRTVDDYRFGKGTGVDINSFKLDIDETGEKNCINTFYTKSDFVDLLNNFFKFKNVKIMDSKNDNYQSGKPINNSDIILWGELDG